MQQVHGGSSTLSLTMARKRGPKGGETTRTPGGLRRVAVLLTEGQYRELRRLAYEREESRSAIIREALDCYLESQG